jgi:neutral ceramidase
LAFVVNFQAHPTIHTVLRPRDVTRDVPGGVCDIIEAALPGVTALYLQGACGDVNFLRSYTTPERCHEPARLVAGLALACQAEAREIESPVLAVTSQQASIPTRRWKREDIEHDRDEAQRRLKNNDIVGWQETIGRAMTNNPTDMVKRHGGDELKAVQAMCRFNLAWTYEMLKDWETRPETLETELQALRIGDLYIAANSSEFFSSLALDVRNRSGLEHLMISCYSNGRIGYMPDAYDIAAKSYAAWQSPKYCNQFPFTNESGPAMCDGMLMQLSRCRDKS